MATLFGLLGLGFGRMGAARGVAGGTPAPEPDYVPTYHIYGF